MTLNSRCQAIGYILCFYCLLDTISNVCSEWERVRLDTVTISIIGNSICNSSAWHSKVFSSKAITIRIE